MATIWPYVRTRTVPDEGRLRCKARMKHGESNPCDANNGGDLNVSSAESQDEDGKEDQATDSESDGGDDFSVIATVSCTPGKATTGEGEIHGGAHGAPPTLISCGYAPDGIARAPTPKLPS